MNNDINKTLQALVPILQMNGENVQSIEAVQNWYTINGTEYMKEVAEITYTSGYRKYADIGCDANLTAVYDVMAVLQEIKPNSKCIGRIVRGVYEMPAVEPELKKLSEWKADFKGYINALNIPKDDYDGIMEYIDEVPAAEQEAPEMNVGNIDTTNLSPKEAIALLRNLEDSLDSYCELNEEGKTAFRMAIEALNCSEIPNNSDTISRQQAIDALKEKVFRNLTDEFYGAMQVLDELPSAQPEQSSCEYCHEDSDGYVLSVEKNGHVYIQNGKLALRANGWWGECAINFCPMCGRKLRGEQE